MAHVNNTMPTVEREDRVVRVENISHAPHSNILHVSWTIDRFCNYSCSYCWKNAHSPVRNGLPTEVLTAGYHRIRRAASKNGRSSFVWVMAGGEATLHPGFMALASEMADDVCNTDHSSLRLASNMSNGKRWWDGFSAVLRRFDDPNVSASWHREQAGDIKAFAAKCSDLVSNGIRCNVTIVMDPAMFDQLADDALHLHSIGLSVHVRTMRDPISSRVVHYSDDQLRYLSETTLSRDYGLKTIGRTIGISFEESPGSQLRLTHANGTESYLLHPDHLGAIGLTMFQGWTCDAGRTSIVVTESGEIRRGWGCGDKRLGNISGEFSLLRDAAVCVSRIGCACSHDLAIPKVCILG